MTPIKSPQPNSRLRRSRIAWAGHPCAWTNVRMATQGSANGRGVGQHVANGGKREPPGGHGSFLGLPALPRDKTSIGFTRQVVNLPCK